MARNPARGGHPMEHLVRTSCSHTYIYTFRHLPSISVFASITHIYHSWALLGVHNCHTRTVVVKPGFTIIPDPSSSSS
jgi:hypothetical protein